MVEISNAAKGKIEEVLKVNPGKHLRIMIDGAG